MGRFTFPNEYDTAEEIIVPINISLIPYVSGALRIFEKSYTWASDEDYERGYNAFVELQSYMSGRTVRDIVEAINQQYRLLDTALNATQYSSSPNPADPARPLISPAIPDVPPVATTDPAAMRAQVERLHQLAENAATGAVYASDSALAGTVGLDFDGSWSARLSVVAGQLDRLITSLDGGGQVGPTDNVLTALRGTVTASNDRNVVDSVGGFNLVQLLDEVEALLIQIRDKVQ